MMTEEKLSDSRDSLQKEMFEMIEKIKSNFDGDASLIKYSDLSTVFFLHKIAELTETVKELTLKVEELKGNGIKKN